MDIYSDFFLIVSISSLQNYFEMQLNGYVHVLISPAILGLGYSV